MQTRLHLSLRTCDEWVRGVVRTAHPDYHGDKLTVVYGVAACRCARIGMALVAATSQLCA